MITCFLQYNITPVFIFDGKPPPEKYALLLLRESNKAKAEAKYNEIITKTSDHRKLDSLKNQFVRLNDTNFKQAKDLLDAYGIQHITSPTESDPLLVYLVQSGKAWACLSEDMDMFAYGCIRVCRGLNLDTHELLLYDTESILRELDVSLEDFRQILVLSGTDYNEENGDLYMTWNYYSKYKEQKKEQQQQQQQQKDFIQWLLQNTNYIQNLDKFSQCYCMFLMEKYDVLFSSFNRMQLMRTPYHPTSLRRVLEKDGFMFLT